MIPGFIKRIRRRPTLPHSCPCSTIGAEELNFRVRDGNGCDLFAIATEKSISLFSVSFFVFGFFGIVIFTKYPTRNTGINLYQDTKHLNFVNILKDHANYFVAKPHDRLVPVS